MNILRNSLRQITSLKLVPANKCNEFRYFTTTVDATALPISKECIPPPEPNSEPDKLYRRVELEIRGVDPAVLKSYSWFTTTAASHLGVEVGKSWALRKAEKERHTLLKSVHIQKKHRVQYEIRTYFRFIHLNRLTGSTCDTLLEYLERNLPEGVAMKVTKVEIQKFPDYLLDIPNREQEAKKE